MTATASTAVKWSMLGEATTRIASPVVLLALAAILTPTDFGIVAAGTVVVALTQTVSEAGLGRAIVQRQILTDDAATTAFWLTSALSLLLAGGLVIAAPFVAMFFASSEVGQVTAALAIQLPIAALGSIQAAVLQREMAFRRLFSVRLLSAFGPAVVSIPLALADYGYWALVGGTLFGQAAQTILLWLRSDWKPTLRFDWIIARELYSFGKWAMTSALLAWAFGWMDSILVGHYLGTGAMGQYRTGSSMVTMVLSLVFAPILPVLYSLMSRMARDMARIRASLLDFAAFALALSLPVAAGVVASSPHLDVLLAGSAWYGLGNILAFLVLGQSLTWMVAANGEAYRAMGKPHVETWTMGVSVALYIGTYVLVAPHGLQAILIARVALALVGILIHLIAARLTLGTPLTWWMTLSWKPLASSSISYLTAVALTHSMPPLEAMLVSMTLALALHFLIMSLVLDKKRMLKYWSLIRAA